MYSFQIALHRLHPEKLDFFSKRFLNKTTDRKILGETNKLTFENTMKNFMIDYINDCNSM